MDVAKTMLVILVHIFLFVTLSSSRCQCNQEIQDPLDPIIFPNQNEVPPRYSSDIFSYHKATKAVHYAAIRLLLLSREDTETNWVVSPLSLAAVLGQLMLGAKGNFHRILGEILSPGNSKEKPGLEVHKELGSLVHLLQNEEWTRYLLNINSALFIDPDIELKCSYKHALADIYNVEVFRSNFSTGPEESQAQINEWVKKATYGKIDNILSVPVSSTTASLFINTVYFKGGWKTPFDPQLTKPGFFNLNKTHQIPVDYMVGEVEVRYVEDENLECTMVGIPYEDSEVVLYIMLPQKNHFKLTDFAARLSFEIIEELISKTNYENVTLILPKVKLSSMLSLRKPIVRAVNKTKYLRYNGNTIRDSRGIDNEELEFSRLLSNSYKPQPLPLKINGNSDKVKITFNMGSASDDYRFLIDDILHRVELEINEHGTEAVAVSTTLIDYIGGKIVRVNRPFLFLIRHEYTKTNLFLGTVYKPEGIVKK